jgi:hypothetical protein
MLDLTPEQRQMLIDKLPDAANVALAALVFGQFIGDKPFSTPVAIGGIALWLVKIGRSLLLGRRRPQ